MNFNAHAGARLPPTAHKAKALKLGRGARERSPVCLRNVFCDSALDEDSGYNASISSLPRTQREPLDRYRCVVCLGKPGYISTANPDTLHVPFEKVGQLPIEV